jgi:DNA-binding PadR family transcriptional regulator
MLGHPEGSPSFDEMVRINPSKAPEEIDESLDNLVEVGLARKTDCGPEDMQESEKCYELTDKAREVLDDYDVFPDANEIKEKYASVTF